MRLFDRDVPKPDDSEPVPLDPVAVTLAIWLGLVVSVTGLMRLSANAAAMQDQQGARPLVAMQLTPYGS